MGATCCKESKNDDTATPKTQVGAKPAVKQDKPIRPKVKLIPREEPLPDTAPLENPFTPPSQKKSASPQKDKPLSPGVTTGAEATPFSNSIESPSRQSNSGFFSVLAIPNNNRQSTLAPIPGQPSESLQSINEKKIAAINEATKISTSALESLEKSCNEQFSAKMQITLVGAAKTKPSSRNSVGDVSILLDTFAGNTTWLLGSQAIESIDINEIIPTAIQEVHKKWVKTIFNASKNIRSSWSNLTSMLSRPTKIFNPSTNEENLVSIEMGNAEATTSDEKITLSVTITKLTPASNISAEKQSEINALELASKRKRAVFFESLLKSPLTEPSMLEQSDISLERSQTASL